MKPHIKIFTWIIACALVVSGCSALNAEPDTTPVSNQAETFDSIISATGVVIPEQWAALSMAGQGLVAEVLVAEGQAVSTGQPLVRLEGQAAAAAKVSTAQSGIIEAQQALDDLNTRAAVEAALAWQTLADAQQAVIDAEREMVPFDLQKYKDDLDAARKAVTEAEDALGTAKEDFEPYADWDADNTTRNDYQRRLDDAQRAYDEAVRLKQELEFDKEQAAAALALAQANLAYAEEAYDQRQPGPDPDALALAVSALEQANAQLLAAQEALNNLELSAPFDGVVCGLYARQGEWLTPGMPVIELGNLDGLRVETTDMNEIDAARIQPDDPVMVTFDALPGVTVNGTVQRIAYKSAEGSGVNYTVIILLDEIPEGLRWGMTAFVDVEVDQ
ncbi:MAG TPA: efflux RND transporter periplasmic adaptor subunit [Anaerolineales bacterium]|nr:efflux RND transporter periplasmic adaptor subunit [Anaerolineales bacterium]